MKAWQQSPYALVLSESSPTDYVVTEVKQWAAESQCTVAIDHSKYRRIQKEALNAAFAMPEVANADIVIITNDDVLLEEQSVRNLISALRESPSAVLAVGTTLPDPSFRRGERRAGSWQLLVVNKLARLLPTTCTRSEGALWATRGSFAKSYRWPIDGGSVSDDVEIANYVIEHHLEAVNVSNAIAYKIPPEGFEEFKNQTRRSQDSKASQLLNQVPSLVKLRAVLSMFFAHPISGTWYLVFRLRLLTIARKEESRTTEDWKRQTSTLR